MKKKIILPRRDFFRSTGVVATSILLPRQVMAALSKIKKPIKLGMIADLHQDVMHDGPARLKAFLDAMKEGAIFVNTSRGSLVDEHALALAIQSKGIKAGLDVYADEPGSGDESFNSTISSAPPACGTHHIGASTQQAQDAIAAEAVRVVKHYLATGDVLHCVNRASKTAAALQLAVRHLNKPGVLSHVFDLIGEAGINVEEMENIIFAGSGAACARIQLSAPPPPATLEGIQQSPHILATTVLPL